jgi:predicted ATPase/class 3 adenylate cyclase
MSTWSGPELPTGTLTFLFTDVEGSTRLWEQHPRAMRSVMARHDALLTTVFEQHDGVVVRPRGEGDSLFVVFIRATDAVAAALAGQRALAADDWGPISPLLVRMGLHTGEADIREGDYYGSSVNRCARIRAAGHGGQILLSAITAQLVRSSLPDRVGLRDLGRHRLKDLAEPEHLHQLTASDLADAFPPLKTLDSRARNLPLQLTSFIGREHEIADLVALLGTERLVTLTGPGGSGKTRLALQVAARVLDHFPDGVWFVDLTGVRDPAGVVPAIAQVLTVRESEGRSLTDSLVAALRGKRFLLLLDNFEQVVETAPTVHDLLVALPSLTLLVTSRLLLRLDGEKEFPVAPLPLPMAAAHTPLANLAQNPAVQLFVDRARALQPTFALTADTAEAITAICRRLDGLPLALELAATRVKLLPPVALLARLDRSLPLLTGGSRAAPERQRTLRATIAWSHDLLRPEEQALFRRLAVFVGGWTLAAAEAVCAFDGAGDVLEGLATLVDHSLVHVWPGADGEPRLTLLETVREFALEQLQASADAEGVRRRHAVHFADLGRALLARPAGMLSAAAPRLLTTARQEQANVRTALAWALAQQESDTALWLFVAFAFVVHQQAQPNAFPTLDAVLALPSHGVPLLSRLVALIGGMLCALFQRDPAGFARYQSKALAQARELGDAYYLAMTTSAAAQEALFMPPAAAEDWTAIVAFGAESVAHARTTRDPGLLSHVLTVHSLLLLLAGEDAGVRPAAEEGLAFAEEVGNDLSAAMAFAALGQLDERAGDLTRAVAELAEVQRRWTAAQSLNNAALAGLNRGRSLLLLGDRAAARAALGEALQHNRQQGQTAAVAWCMAALGVVACNDGAFALAARLFGAATAIQPSFAGTIYTRPQFTTPLADAEAEARAALGDERYAEQVAAGRALGAEQAVVFALAALSDLAGSEPVDAAVAAVGDAASHA